MENIKKSNDLIFIDKILDIVCHNEKFNYKKDKNLMGLFLGYGFSITMFIISLIFSLMSDNDVSKINYAISIVIIIVYSCSIMYSMKMSRTYLFDYKQEAGKVLKMIDECIIYSRTNAEEKICLVEELDELEMKLRVKYNIIKLENNIIYYMKDKDNFTNNIDEAKEFTHDEMIKITKFNDNYFVKTIQ